jgi:hypothetical protein
MLRKGCRGKLPCLPKKIANIEHRISNNEVRDQGAEGVRASLALAQRIRKYRAKDVISKNPEITPAPRRHEE